MEEFKSKTIWITGAGSGIGRALAQAFDKCGAILILSGRKLAPLEETKSSLKNLSSCKIIQIDLSKHDEIETIFNKNKELLSNVEILVNNAGISQRSLAEHTNFEVYKRLIDVNYLGTVKLSLLMLPVFKERNSGRFVNISSVAGKFGVPVRSGYSGSKFALHGFFDALAVELNSTNIGITMVCPGFIKTDISKNSLTADGSKQGTMDKAQENGMSVEEMANIVLKGIHSNKREILVGGFKETKLAVWVSRIFPSLFRKIIARSEVT